MGATPSRRHRAVRRWAVDESRTVDDRRRLAAMTVRIIRRPADGAALVTVSAPDLASANRAMAERAVAAHQSWPSDVRFASPPQSVVAVPMALPGLETVVAALTEAGARVAAADVDAVLRSGWLPDDSDVVVVPAIVDDTGDLSAVS